MAGPTPAQQADLHLTAGKLAYHLTDWNLAAEEMRAALAMPDMEPATATAARCHLGAALIMTGAAEEGATLASAGARGG